jgi:UDP-N-acetylmuramyl pentapeptide phosphotransferase/UDP-N-acetylglucosamine-1-phosphate transferase
MKIVLAVLVGYLAGRVTWLLARSSFSNPVLARQNFRGRTLPTAAGVLIPVAALAVQAGRVVASSLDIGGEAPGGLTAAWVLVLLAAAGFALLGAVDDLAGTDGDLGFRGHLGALRSGRSTTGVLKLLGGGCLALAVVGPLASNRPGRLLADAALVALAANLGNLLDRAPGRTIKVSTVCFAVLAIGTSAPVLLGPVGAVVGAGLGLLLDDLHEHLMLGDAGSNALGAVLGLGVVMTTASSTRTAVLVVLVALNALGEIVSFSRVIDAVPPLRAFDRAGRRA